MNSYTYEKLHVWKVTRIEYWVLIGALLYAYRFFHGTFDTRMFSNVKLFIRGTFGAFCPLRPTILFGRIPSIYTPRAIMRTTHRLYKTMHNRFVMLCWAVLLLGNCDVSGTATMMLLCHYILWLRNCDNLQCYTIKHDIIIMWYCIVFTFGKGFLGTRLLTNIRCEFVAVFWANDGELCACAMNGLLSVSILSHLLTYITTVMSTLVTCAAVEVVLYRHAVAHL